MKNPKKTRATPPKGATQNKSDKNTLVCLLLDRTGSMQKCRDETISGFNAYIEKMQKELPDSARFTMMQFDSQGMEMIYERTKLSDVEPLTPETYVPRANTPLYDAMAKLIHATRERVHSWLGAEGKFKVLFVSLTDGLENASSEWSLEKVQSLIKEMEHVHHWTFAHIGTGMEGWQSGSTMYHGTQSISNVGHGTHKNIDKAFAKLANATLFYCRGATGQSVQTSVWGKADADLDE